MYRGVFYPSTWIRDRKHVCNRALLHLGGFSWPMLEAKHFHLLSMTNFESYVTLTENPPPLNLADGTARGNPG
jgi:hypothetical protein